MYTLTKNGEKLVEEYLSELRTKRTGILSAGADTANETVLPTKEDIVSDIEFCGIDMDDPDGPCYYNGWAVTDNYDADYPILLKLGRDFTKIPVSI